MLDIWMIQLTTKEEKQECKWELVKEVKTLLSLPVVLLKESNIIETTMKQISRKIQKMRTLTMSLMTCFSHKVETWTQLFTIS